MPSALRRALLLALLSVTGCDGTVRYFGGFRFDVHPPTIVSVSPANGAIDVDLGQNIVVTFSEPIDGESITPSSMRVTWEGVELGGTVSWENSNTQAVFSPTAPRLPYFASLDVEVATTLRDYVGHDLAGPNVSSFTTRDLSWNAPTVLSSTAGNASAARAVVRSNGLALAVWQQNDGVRESVWSRRIVASGWTPAETIEDDNGADAVSPQVASDGAGAFSVWAQPQGSVDSLWANRFDGTNWGARTLIASGSGRRVHDIAAAGGDATVVWIQWDGVRYNAWTSTFVLGTGWTGAALLEINDADHALSPRVAASRDSAVAVWYQLDGSGRYDIWSARRAGGVWSAPTLVEGDPAFAGGPEIALDRFGNGYAIWCQTAGSFRSVRANRVVDGGWGTAQTIESDDTGATCETVLGIEPGGDPFDPNSTFAGFDESQKIALTESGAVAVWAQENVSGLRDIWSNTNVVGIGWQQPSLLEQDVEDAYAPQIVSDERGFITVVWRTFDGMRWNVVAARYRPGLGWSAPENVENSDGNVGEVRIAVDRVSGRAATAWLQSDSGVDRVFVVLLE